ncbi:beta-propeller domain-containing protein [Candidatus Bathyarchaeota archaeon]|nr:beta-propeller domain-containing protein [Candidatus Bathyarchaeota archaeon]
MKLTTYAVIGLICGSLLMGSVLQFEMLTNLPTVNYVGSLQNFKSASDLQKFLEKQTSSSMYRVYELGISQPSMNDAEKGGTNYSGTNIQVAGVDEADKIKTDGKYLYIAEGTIVYIANAYPPEEAKILSRIKFNEQVGDLFISGDKLVVFSQNYSSFDGIERLPKMPGIMPPIKETQVTLVKVYDVTNKLEPKLERTFKAEGNYVSSRLIGDYVYLIIQKNAYIVEGETQTPVIQDGEKIHQIGPTEIYYYWNSTEPWYAYTTIFSINSQVSDQPVESETLLLGASSTIYVSTQHLYLTVANWSNTTIHKIQLDNGKITFKAEGTVPGWVLNQFSMDEYNGYFRIATTNGRMWWGWRISTTQQSSGVYVLDENMKTVGQIEGIAPGEEIYSARFTGKRCYLVTFKKVDPFFVIDLSNPSNPTILGKLKIPGYSNYLHPYDDNHIIGLGKETVEAEEGDFSWYQGIKISIFDVTDITNPKELVKIEVGDRGTDSPALYDHHAFLFSKEKNLLVIPILEAKIDPSKYSGIPPTNAYGEYISQGAYVFEITLKGIKLRGIITHIEDDSLLKSGFWFDSESAVERSLYIENYLYTISSRMVKINNLNNLKEVNQFYLK